MAPCLQAPRHLIPHLGTIPIATTWVAVAVGNGQCEAKAGVRQGVGDKCTWMIEIIAILQPPYRKIDGVGMRIAILIAETPCPGMCGTTEILGIGSLCAQSPTSPSHPMEPPILRQPQKTLHHHPPLPPHLHSVRSPTEIHLFPTSKARPEKPHLPALEH